MHAVGIPDGRVSVFAESEWILVSICGGLGNAIKICELLGGFLSV